MRLAILGCIFASRVLGASCESLQKLNLPDTSVISAQIVDAGAFHVEGRAATNDAFKTLPAFCRVTLTIKPTSDSDIKVEVWLPVSGWNHKFEARGNGGWSGAISPAALAQALQHGYAAAMTDTGHQGSSASFALGHPEKLIDYGYRAVHEMTVKAKAVIEAFYGEAPRLAYWDGCSAGGKQGLKEAQRFPGDYDGIVAGAPAAHWIARAAESLWVAQASHADDASYIPPIKYALIHGAVLETCDAKDGVKDGVLEDPTRCNFDPQILKCSGDDGPSCLTAPQVETARNLYATLTNPRTRQWISNGLERGSELGWATYAGPQPLSIGLDHFKYVVFQNPDWDYRALNFETDIALAQKIDHGTIDATDPDLSKFFAHGGKLIQYHGWSDPQIPPGNSVVYYQNVLEKLGVGVKIADSYRLFMVPGMAHCGGGDGTSSFDAMSALEKWVEHKQPPERIEAKRVRNGSVDRTRPLCPFPQVAKYKGSGSTDDAANFICSRP